MSDGFWVLLGIVVGVWLGWNTAHVTVAVECEKLGGFYVGKQVFRCVEVKHADQ